MILKECASENIFAFLKVHACLTFNFVTNFFFTVFLLFLGRKHKWVLQERQVPRSAQSKIPNDVSCFWGKVKLTCYYSPHDISYVILLHDKFVQFDWLRAVVFQLDLKYLHMKITNLFWLVVYCLFVIFGINTTRDISKLPQISPT